MADIIFPTDTTAVTPATGDLMMIADVSDGNALKECALSALPVSTATQTALDSKVSQASDSGSSGRMKVSAGADKSITDYATAGIVKSDANGVVSAATDGTDYLSPTSADYTKINYTSANKIGNPTHIDTLQEIFNHEFSAGVMYGCDYTDNGNGTISIATGQAMIRSAADPHTPLYAVVVPAQANISLTDNATNYVYLDYNAGTPQFAVSTSITSFNCLDKCIAYMIHRDGNTLEIVDAREQNVDGNRKTRKLFLDLSKFIHSANGSVLGSPSGLTVSLTAGSFYFMLQKLEHVAFDTSVAGTANENVFKLWYRDGVGGWTSVADSKTITSTTYDSGTGTPATLDNNKYGVTWLYIINDTPSKLNALMGQAQYADLASARIASLPATVPTVIDGMGSLVGFVIYQKSASVFSDVRSAFSQTFASSSPTTHNGLSGLQGGSVNEYYHITSAQATVVANTSGTNTGDQTSVTGNSGSTDALKSATTTVDVSSATAPSSGQVLTATSSTAATWQTPSAGGSSLWTAVTGTRTGNTTFTITGDYTPVFAKGLVLKWTESSVVKNAFVAIPSTYSAPDTTVTICGDTMASIDSNSLKYAMVGVEGFVKRFAVAGSIGATWADVSNCHYAMEPERVLGADLFVGTAGTTNSTTVDINKAGTTMFTTKPTLATTVASSPTPFAADSGTSLALGDKVTLDIVAFQTTNATDLYAMLYVWPTRLNNLL